MADESYGFAFDNSDLTPLSGDEDSVSVSVTSARARRGVTASSASKDVVREAQKEMKEMKKLIQKHETGTATREEKIKLEIMNARMSRMRRDLEKSATRGSDRELEKLKSENKTKTHDLLISFKQKQIRSIMRAVCAAESVDLAFIIDCTSSMQPYIENVKANIKGIVSQVATTNGNLRLRLAVVAYRDLTDGPKRHEVLDFVSSIPEFETFVGGLEAVGGGDTPEDMAGGVQQANRLTWSNPTRVAFLIADCPCHGTEFHGFADAYPGGTPGISIVEELRNLQRKASTNGSMSVHFGRIKHYTDSMLGRLKSAYEIDLEVSAIDNSAKLTSSVTSSVRRSIFKTMSVAGPEKLIASFAPPADPHILMETVAGGGHSRAAQLKSFSLVSRMPSKKEWQLCPALRVDVFKNSKITSMRDLKLPIGFGRLLVRKIIGSFSAGHSSQPEKGTMFMRRAKNPFAQGEIRIAFHGQLACEIKGLSSSENLMVMKSFKHVGKGIHDRQQYLKQMEVSNIALFLSKKYNASSARPRHCAAVTFLPVCVIEEQSSARENLGERRFCVEPPLPSGHFKKYSNNTGYWAEDIIDESLLRFSVWTYEATNGYMMVTDLQGVKSVNKNKFFLTDPVILCKDIVRFGNTNLGESFLKKCIDSTRSHMRERGWA